MNFFQKPLSGLVAIILALGVSTALTGCNNNENNQANWQDVSANFDHVHVHSEDKINHLEITSYYFYSHDNSMIYLNTKDYGWILTSTVGTTLYTGTKCPVCNHTY